MILTPNIGFKSVRGKSTPAIIPTYNAIYQAVLDYAENESKPIPDSAQRDLDNDLAIAIDNTGIWPNEDLFAKFKGTADPEFKLIDWKRLITMNAYGGLTWSGDGVKGNGTNGWIDSMYTPSTDAVNYGLNSASIGYSLFDVGTAGGKAIIGAYTGTGNYTLIAPKNSTSSYFMLNNDGLYDFNSSYDKIGYTQIDRISDTQMQLDADNIYNSPSGAFPSLSYGILARHRTSGNTDLFSDAGISFLRIGANSVSDFTDINSIL